MSTAQDLAGGIEVAGTAPDARLLIVDDQEANVVSLERIFRRWGYEHLVSTTDSPEVLDLVGFWSPDLLVLDLEMPAPDGYEILDALAPANIGAPRLPILIVTADASPHATRRALEHGASDVVGKPLHLDEVRLRTRNLLAARRLQSRLAAENAALKARVGEGTRSFEAARPEILDHLNGRFHGQPHRHGQTLGSCRAPGR